MKQTISLLALLFLFQAKAQWTSDPTVNTIVCNAVIDQSDPVGTSDGAGGTIVAWQDQRAGGYKVYAQRMNAAGVAQWAANGVLVYSQNTFEVHPSIVSDGAGGAFILWYKDTNGSDYSIYAQHVDASGNALWPANGKKVSSKSDCQYLSALADGWGGFFISYYKEKIATGLLDNIYGQHINAQGENIWGASDVAICSGSSLYSCSPKMASDGASGIIITWGDSRDEANGGDIYAQRISYDGVIQWPANGIAVKTGPTGEEKPEIISDGLFGAIIAWKIADNLPLPQGIYAQKINAAGVKLWAPDGVPVTTTYTSDLKLASYGGSWAVLSWTDYRFSAPGNTNARAYVQQLSWEGIAQWAENGICLKNASGYSQGSGDVYFSVIEGGSAYFAFLEANNSGVFYSKLYMQKVAPNGDFLWDPNGIPIGTNAFHSHFSPTIVPDSAGGLNVVFAKEGEGLNRDIYVQNVHSDGQLGPYLLSSALLDTEENFRIYPNPTGGEFTVRSTVAIDKIIVSDLLGKEVLNITPGSLETSLELSRQAKGVYFIKAVSGTTETVKKLILK